MDPAASHPFLVPAASPIRTASDRRGCPGKDAGESLSHPVTTGRLSLAFPAAAIVAFFLVLFLFPAASRADIYQWEDNQGTMHFTDDVSTIPAQYRKEATPLVHEGPSVISPETSPASPAGGQAALPPSGSDLSAEEAATREEAQKAEIASQVEQQKARISTKEEFIRAVDQKRSLAINPLRNRYVDQADMDLYNKYKEELPSDKERLRELESSLQSFK